MVDEAVVADTLRYVDQYLDDMVTQRAVERTLMSLIQA